MFIIHEGEILLKEKYGSTAKERFYVKPPDQGNIVITGEQKFSDISSWFAKIFLPQGYPNSVSKDYISYQMWDTAQAFCSTITGTLATQEVLRGVGVGDIGATPLAATVTWVIKDGCGHLGRILFAYSHGTYLDAYSKKWRLYADTLNDAAMCIEIALPLFRNYTTFALCVSTVMKAIVGVAGGATRAAMTQHHAVRGNLADVTAKDSAQETAVNLIASFTALLIITLFGNSLIIFIVMMMFHIIFNYFAVRAVCLRTLNEPRFLQVIDMYLRQEVIATPCKINQIEPIIFYQLGPNLLDLKICGFQIKLGCSIKKSINKYYKAQHLRNISEMYDERNYILFPNTIERKMYILLKEETTTDDVLCAYFHAVILAIITCAINDYSLPAFQNTKDPRPFSQVCHTLQSAEWSREPVTEIIETINHFEYEPSYDLMKYVDSIVQKEWDRIRDGLLQTGWDLNKHLLVVDEWRIVSQKFDTEPISSHKLMYLDSIIESTSKVAPFDDVISDTDIIKENDEETFTIEPERAAGNLSEASKTKLDTLKRRLRDEMVPESQGVTSQTFVKKSDVKSQRSFDLQNPQEQVMVSTVQNNASEGSQKFQNTQETSEANFETIRKKED